MKTSTKLIALLALAGTVMLHTTCEKIDRDNPFDPQNTLDPESWAPSNLQIEDESLTTKKLIWQYDGVENIEGFEVERKYGSTDVVIEYIRVGKDARQWVDNAITPDTTLTYTYSLFTIAGENRSSFVTASSPVSFPPPTNLQITKNSITSLTLSWTDNSNGEDGFVIEKRWIAAAKANVQTRL